MEAMLLAEYEVDNINSQREPYAPPTRRVYDFDAADPLEIVQFFRMKREDIDRLAIALGVEDWIPIGRRCSGRKGLYILLSRLAYPKRLVDLAHFWGRGHGVSFLSDVCNYMVDWIYSKFSKMMFCDPLRLAPMLPAFCDAISAKGMPQAGIYGFMDVTTVGTCRPSKLQRQLYSGHKRKHLLKFQSVVTPDGIMSHAYGPMEGRRTDIWTLACSGLEPYIDAHFGAAAANRRIYADGGYTMSSNIFCPYRDPERGGEEQEYNTAMSTGRITVEWGYMLVKRYFAYLDFSKSNKIFRSPVAQIVHVAVFLMNCKTCLEGGNMTSEYFGMNPPDINDFLRPNTDFPDDAPTASSGYVV